MSQGCVIPGVLAGADDDTNRRHRQYLGLGVAIAGVSDPPPLPSNPAVEKSNHSAKTKGTSFSGESQIVSATSAEPRILFLRKLSFFSDDFGGSAEIFPAKVKRQTATLAEQRIFPAKLKRKSRDFGGSVEKNPAKLKFFSRT